MRTSFHHQPEAQHPISSAIHKLIGRLPHLMAHRVVLLRCQYFVALGGEADMLRPTPIAEGACASSASIRLDVCVLDHLSPHAELNLDECCQLLRRAGKSLEAHVLEPCLSVWAVDDFA